MNRLSSFARSLQLLAGILLMFGTAQSTAGSLRMAAPATVPPYVLRETDGGLFLELVKAALAAEGHELSEIDYVSNLRAVRRLQEDRVDLAMHIPAGTPHTYRSEPVVHYWNVGISLVQSQLRVNELNDLHNLRVVAFQNAADLLGEEFRKAIPLAAKYSEQPNQRAQVVELFRGGADLLVMDLRIFSHYRRQLVTHLNISQPLRIHSFIPPTPRAVTFRSEQLRDSFNRGLNVIRENGIYADILEKHDYRSD